MRTSYLALFMMVLIISTTFSVGAPIVPMNKAFNALVELIPFLTDKSAFLEKKNEKMIQQHMEGLREAFKSARHEGLLKQDIFAPSLEMVRDNLGNSLDAFKKGKKDYALWRMREITSQCMDCHTRLPISHPSSFQQGKWIDKSKFSDRYNFGLAQLIVRLYPEAKATFTHLINEYMVKKQYDQIMQPMKQLLLIETKIMKEPSEMLTILQHYEDKPGISSDDKMLMKTWKSRLKVWSNSPYLRPIHDDKSVSEFITKVLKPLFKNDSLYVGKYDVDLLIATGLLSNFLFENPQSKFAPDAIYWIGLSEKYLKRENYFGTGELLLKECVRRYPESAIAPKCFDEYKESMEFEFTGSRGSDLPVDVEKELNEMEALIKSKKGKKGN